MENNFEYTDEMYQEDKKIADFTYKRVFKYDNEIKKSYKEDLIQVAVIQLMKARKEYDESKGSYATFEVKVAHHAMCNFVKKKQFFYENTRQSLTEPLGEDLTLEDTIGTTDEYNKIEQQKYEDLKAFVKCIILRPQKYKMCYCKRQIQNRKTHIKTQQIYAIEYFVNGLTEKQIQDKYKITKQATNLAVNKYRKILQDALKESKYLN